MGELILFRPTRNAARPTSAGEQPQSARILFFTGVRYERHQESPAAAEKKTPPKGGINGAGGGRRKRRG